MSVILSLAALFAGVILVGAAGVFLHDLLEGRWLGRNAPGQGGGQGGPVVFSELGRARDRRTASRGGQVVWVRAGSYRPAAQGTDQRRPEPGQTTVTAKRVTLR